MSQEFLMSPEISVAIFFCEKKIWEFFFFQIEHHEFFKQETELVRRQGI